MNIYLYCIDYVIIIIIPILRKQPCSLSFIMLFEFNDLIMNFTGIMCLVIIAWLLIKLYRFWTVTKLYAAGYFDIKIEVSWLFWQDLDHKIFNPDILEPNVTYELGTLLPPYPNLWYPVIQSTDLKKGQVKPLYVLEKNLVVYRSLSGNVHALDAFCPHLGAHLGVGGSVLGEDIRCPFHNWTFNGSGHCTGIPGLKSIMINSNKFIY